MTGAVIATQETNATADDAAGGRLGAYAPWQLLDYLRSGGLTGLVIGLLLGMPLYVTRAMPGMGHDQTASVIETLSFLLVLLATQRISAGDRVGGTYRFYFAKPVAVAAFYGQKFLVVGAGVLLVAAALVVLALLEHVPVSPGGALAAFALVYVLLGGLVFLCSAVTRFDWTVAVALWAAAFLLRAIFGTHGWPLWPLRILPPVEALALARGAVFAGVLPATSDLAWVLGYGIGAFVLGLLVLSRRPLAS